jgi:hypothetical protein
MDKKGSSAYHGMNSNGGSSFSNGNGGGPDCLADWYAGHTEVPQAHWWLFA